MSKNGCSVHTLMLRACTWKTDCSMHNLRMLRAYTSKNGCSVHTLMLRACTWKTGCSVHNLRMLRAYTSKDDCSVHTLMLRACTWKTGCSVHNLRMLRAYSSKDGCSVHTLMLRACTWKTGCSVHNLRMLPAYTSKNGCSVHTLMLRACTSKTGCSVHNLRMPRAYTSKNGCSVHTLMLRAHTCDNGCLNLFLCFHGACSEDQSMQATTNIERMLLMIDFGSWEHAPDRQWKPLRACSWTPVLALLQIYTLLQLRACVVIPVYCCPSMLRTAYLIDWEHAWSNHRLRHCACASPIDPTMRTAVHYVLHPRIRGCTLRN